MNSKKHDLPISPPPAKKKKSYSIIMRALMNFFYVEFVESNFNLHLSSEPKFFFRWHNIKKFLLDRPKM